MPSDVRVRRILEWRRSPPGGDAGMTRARSWWPIAGAVAMAPIAGTLTVVSPRAGLLSAAALSVVVFATYYRQRLPRMFLVLVGISLFGYTFLGKGYAYFGVSPIFIGELLLLFGVLAALLGGGFMPALRSPISWLVILWAVWGLVCTVPYLGVYGLDALRDATIWGYGAFAILVAGFMLRLQWWTKASDAYARWFWWFAFWSPVAGVIFATVEPSIPRVPGSDIPLLFVKAGDFGVQLAGAATFVLVGLADSRWRRSPHRVALEWLWWMAWLAGVAITGAASRGALVSVFIAVATVMLLHRRAQFWKPALRLVRVCARVRRRRHQVERRPGSRGLRPSDRREPTQHRRRRNQHEQPRGHARVAPSMVAGHHRLHRTRPLFLDGQGIRHQPGR